MGSLAVIRLTCKLHKGTNSQMFFTGALKPQMANKPRAEKPTTDVSGVAGPHLFRCCWELVMFFISMKIIPF